MKWMVSLTSDRFGTHTRQIEAENEAIARLRARAHWLAVLEKAHPDKQPRVAELEVLATHKISKEGTDA